jgi:dihydroflavonol-4-reductase
VAALLDRGYGVRALRRTTSGLDALDALDPEFAIGDVLDPSSLVSAMDGCALVFHVAAVSDYWRVSRDRTYQVNVDGTRNVMDAALELGVERLVFTSSVGALGVPPPGRLLDESSTFNVRADRFVYGHSKHLAEQVVRDAVGRGLNAVIVNPSAVIGARDVNFIGGSLLREVRRGLTWITFPGSLNWVDAETVGIGHVLAAEHGQTGSRYILGGENVSHRRAMEITADVVLGRKPIVTLPRSLAGPAAFLVDGFNRVWPGTPLLSGEQARLSSAAIEVDCSRARRELAFPFVDFRSSVARAFAWYQDHGYM